MSTDSVSGWNFVLAAALKRVNGNVAVLSSIIAVSELTIELWQSKSYVPKLLLPTTRALDAMRRFIRDCDSPKVTNSTNRRRPQGDSGTPGDSYCRYAKRAVDLRSGERTRYGHQKRLRQLQRTGLVKGERQYIKSSRKEL